MSIICLFPFFIALSLGVDANAASGTATLLLPGFQGHQLQASILAEAGPLTTYVVTCAEAVEPTACGIPGSGITAISGPTLMELVNVNPGIESYLSCQIDGMTYAFCHASQTISATATLAPQHLNWMEVPVTTKQTPESEPPEKIIQEVYVLDGAQPKSIVTMSHIFYALFALLFYCIYLIYVLGKHILIHHVQLEGVGEYDIIL
ncbi:hypothetical protein N7540_005591 [Penicillium herquei]|nr:hypothetical protein N7540_005591 [Penicillium herquei]